MKIIELRAENFKRLKAVEIRPDGSLVVVRGRNAQGKSSVLDAIWAALGGKRAVPPKPIREGEARSEITLNLGNYVVTRLFTERDSYLTVKSADGAKVANPQALLDALIGAISFDPLEFARMKPAEQAKQLAAITGIEFDALNRQRQELFAQRTEVNRRVRQLAATLESMAAAHPGIERLELPPPVNIEDVLIAYDIGTTRHAEHQRALERLNARELVLRAKEDEREQLLKRVAELDAEIAAGWSQIAETAEQLKAQEAAIPDIEAMQRTIREATTAKAQTLVVTEYRAAVADLDEEQLLADEFSARIEALDRQKAELVTGVDLPVNNLTFDENGVYYQGVPFAQCASSEQLKVSTALAISFNPQLRVIRITDGSLLDAESLEILRALADSEDFQIWLERVDDSADGAGILIEDGMVRASGAPCEHDAALAVG